MRARCGKDGYEQRARQMLREGREYTGTPRWIKGLGTPAGSVDDREAGVQALVVGLAGAMGLKDLRQVDPQADALAE